MSWAGILGNSWVSNNSQPVFPIANTVVDDGPARLPESGKQEVEQQCSAVHCGAVWCGAVQRMAAAWLQGYADAATIVHQTSEQISHLCIAW
jgi:hypothetical protein